MPERRAQQRIDDYAGTLRGDYEALLAIAGDDQRDLLDAQFSRYREGYKRHTLAWLNSESNIVSWMIAGPSKFPVARMNKRATWAHNKLEKLIEYRKRALAAIRKQLCPGERPIMSGDSDATTRLAEKIAEAERLQERMKSVNAAHKKFLKNHESLDKSALSEADRVRVRNYKPAYSWEPHPYAPYELTNNNANIRRMKQRLAQISVNQSCESVQLAGDNARYEDCPADNRVRLYFPGKPDAEVRTRLKSCGFRWTPSLGCWQAYRNTRAMDMARDVAGLVEAV